MYKVSDFYDEIGRKTLSLFSNHLFLLFFVIFVVFIGTFGIWVTPTLITDSFSWSGVVDSFTTLNLVSFSLPLLVTLIFDKIVTISAKGKIDDVPVTIWFSVLFLISIILITLLFIIGFKNDDGFSWYSFSAWIIVLYIWVLGNVDNPNYQKQEQSNSASGGNIKNRNKLRKGKS